MTAPATTLDSPSDEGSPMVTLGATRSIPAGWRVIRARHGDPIARLWPKAGQRPGSGAVVAPPVAEVYR